MICLEKTLLTLAPVEELGLSRTVQILCFIWFHLLASNCAGVYSKAVKEKQVRVHVIRWDRLYSVVLPVVIIFKTLTTNVKYMIKTCT